MLAVILLFVLMISVYTLSLYVWSGIWSVATTRIGFWTWIWFKDTVDWGRKLLVDFSAGKTQLVLFDWSDNTGSIDVKMDGSVVEEESSFKILRLSFSSELDWGSYIIAITKTASKKFGVLIYSMKFLSPKIALYLYKSTIWPCMGYCCHVWCGAPSCYLEFLDK